MAKAACGLFLSLFSYYYFMLTVPSKDTMNLIISKMYNRFYGAKDKTELGSNKWTIEIYYNTFKLVAF